MFSHVLSDAKYEHVCACVSMCECKRRRIHVVFLSQYFSYYLVNRNFQPELKGHRHVMICESDIRVGIFRVSSSDVFTDEERVAVRQGRGEYFSRFAGPSRWLRFRGRGRAYP